MRWVTFILFVGLFLSACTVGIVEQGVLTPHANTVWPEETLAPDTSTVLLEETPTPDTSTLPAPTPAPNETTPTVESITPSVVVPTSWKTYTNTRFNYSFQYPPELSLVKGPGSELSDAAFQTADGISFSGFVKPDDPNSGIALGIATDISDENGNLIQCADDQECLHKWMLTLGVSPSEASATRGMIYDQEIIGFQYHADNLLYTQTFVYFVFLRDGRMWLINLAFNNYSPAEIEALMEIILRSIATLAFAS